MSTILRARIGCKDSNLQPPSCEAVMPYPLSQMGCSRQNAENLKECSTVITDDHKTEIKVESMVVAILSLILHFLLPSNQFLMTNILQRSFTASTPQLSFHFYYHHGAEHYSIEVQKLANWQTFTKYDTRM